MNNQSSQATNARRRCLQILEMGSDGSSSRNETAALLMYVTERDYAISLEETDAAQILGNPQAASLAPGTIERAAYLSAQDRIETTIAGFASSFFDIPQNRRRNQWRLLVDECKHIPHLSRWLADLEPALVIERVSESGNKSVDLLVASCSDAFLTRGIEKVRQRQAIAHLYCQDPLRWENAVQSLLLYQPDFVGAIAPWLTGLRRLHLSDATKGAELPLAVRATAPTADAENNWWAWFVVLSIVGGIIRGIAGFSSPPAVRPLQHYSPVTSPGVMRDMAPGHSPEDRERIREALKKLFDGKTMPNQDGEEGKAEAVLPAGGLDFPPAVE
ncbi:MAG: hypothetical protein JWP89_6169 [Schlesneria sp.]|nr:hypothetical protein [Schlesneria sp.]